jgi:RNA polymerase sigma-70 factor (ECF subfamily)
VQEVFFRILKYRHTYQPETSFRAWMYQVGRNVYLDHAGKRKAEVGLPEHAAELSSGETPADRQVQQRQETVLLRRALAALPPEKREVLVMSRFQDLKYEEIASVLKCEVGTVKVRVYRALRELGDRFAALSGNTA